MASPYDTPYGDGENCIRLWHGRQTRAEELKEIHKPGWRASWSWYRNNIKPLTDPTQWWRSNEAIPTPFKIIETILPRYLLSMFENPDWFSVEGRNARSEDYERLCEQLLRTKLDQMRIFPKVYDAIKYCTIMGHVWGKVTWHEEWMTRRIYSPTMTEDPMTGEPVEGVTEETVTEQVYNGPMFDWVPLDKLWADPSGRGRWYIEQIDTTLEELESIQEYQGIYDKVQFKLLQEDLGYGRTSTGDNDTLGYARVGTDQETASGGAIGQGGLVDKSEGVNELEGIPWETVAPQRDGTGVTLLQCWGWVSPEHRGPDGEEWVMHLIANGKYVLRRTAAKTPDGKPPYFPIRSIRIPGRLYGETILTYIGPLSDQQTRLANMRIDEVYLGIWQSILLRKGALASDNQAYFRPGGYLELNVEPTQSLNDVVNIMPRRPLLPDVWTEDQYRQTQQEHIASATDIMQGVGGASDRTTATEVERRLQQGNARHVLQTMLFGHDFQRELLERTWEWLRMRMTRTEAIKLGEEYAEINLADIQAPIDIVVGGGFFALSKGTRVQMDQELITMLQNPLFMEVAKPIPIFRRYLSDRGWKNVERFMMTDEEYEQMKQQQQEAQKQQQIMEILRAVGGAGGGGSAAPIEGMGGGGEMGMEAMEPPDDMSDMQGGIPPTSMAGAPASDVGLESNPLGDEPV